MGLSNVVLLGVGGLNFFWALLVMALTGNMIHEADSGNPSVVNFAIACSIIAMLSLFYLIPAAFIDSLAFHPFIPMGLNLLNTLFWFCCAVALAAELGVHSCGNVGYRDSNGITNGTNPGNRAKRCHEAQASDAFLWFGFAGFAASTVLTGLASRGGANLGAPKRGGTTVSRV